MGEFHIIQQNSSHFRNNWSEVPMSSIQPMSANAIANQRVFWFITSTSNQGSTSQAWFRPVFISIVIASPKGEAIPLKIIEFWNNNDRLFRHCERSLRSNLLLHKQFFSWIGCEIASSGFGALRLVLPRNDGKIHPWVPWRARGVYIIPVGARVRIVPERDDVPLSGASY